MNLYGFFCLLNHQYVFDISKTVDFSPVMPQVEEVRFSCDYLNIALVSLCFFFLRRRL